MTTTKLDPNEFIKEIDISELEDALEKLTGTRISLQINIATRLLMGGGRKEFIVVTSEDLTSSVGVMATSLKEVYVNNDHGGSELYITQGRIEWSTRLGFTYKHRDGGSNGCHICKAWYRFDTKKWDIVDSEGRRTTDE